MNEIVHNKLDLLPDAPGVYLMMDGRGEIIYVGKAVNLKNRVRQYFQSSRNHPAKVIAMVSHIEDFDYILTSNETEAFTLESNLIKQHRPRYNILLKDDKHFPYLRVDFGQDFPRVEVVRRVKPDGARYLGPYLSGIALRDAINAVREYFPIRHCKKDIHKAIARRERPCLMFHIGKCAAPCSGSMTKEQYHALLHQVVAFLEGNIQLVLTRLEEQMNEAADAMEYERAAQYRDRIRAIRALGEHQLAIGANSKERDVFALANDGSDMVVFALFQRNGKVVGTERFTMLGTGEAADVIMASFLKQYYADAGEPPKEVVVRDHVQDAEGIAEWLSEKRGSKVLLIRPQRGDRKKQAELAYQNGMDALARENMLKRRAWERTEGASLLLGELAGMNYAPERMECYDNSHFQGSETVGSMVVFTGGQPDKKEYRRFKIKADTQGDDYAAMREMLTRRFERAKQGDERFVRLPDLLIVDGGRGQLNVALEVLESVGLYDIAAIGLAERNEEIILPGDEPPILLERSSPVLHLVERIRDEAHRFAITYHRSLRSKSALYSVLDDIGGIGPKRRRALFDAFLTMDAIRAASEEELCAVPGMNAPAAKKAYAYFHPEAAPGIGE
ncbi:MAG: excinuclease ABC subunit UvrC [Bacillota bacterium]